MVIKLTAAQARALGVASTPQKKRARAAVAAKECAPNRCTTCGEILAGETAEDRHCRETGHHRFESTAIDKPVSG